MDDVRWTDIKTELAIIDPVEPKPRNHEERVRSGIRWIERHWKAQEIARVISKKLDAQLYTALSGGYNQPPTYRDAKRQVCGVVNNDFAGA